jgi:hypothetical protein
MSAFLFAAMLAGTGAPVGATVPTPVTAPRERVEVLRLRITGVDAGSFARELSLRLPEIPVVSHEAPVEAAGFLVFVDLQPSTRPQSFTLTLVASDGRAYDRTIDADPSSSPDDVVRLLAGNVANLVSAIEAGTERADRRDVPIPAPAVATPACPACPVLPAVTAVAPPTTPMLAPHPPPSFELGVGLVAASATGLGAPADADRFVGGGGGVGLWMRHRSGLLVGTELRVLGHRLPLDTSLVRTRVGLALGYAWRRGAFELATTAALGVEPWWVRAGGRASDLGDTSGRAAPRRPLLGGGVSIVPAHRFSAGAFDVRLGPRIELSASSAVGDRGRVAQLLVNQAGQLRTVGRLGGWELALGLDVVIWIPVRTKADRAPRAKSASGASTTSAR